MLRTITKSNTGKLTLELPEDLIGRTIEVIAFSVDETSNSIAETTSKEDRVKALNSKLKGYAINSGGYKFNRDDANDYE